VIPSQKQCAFHEKIFKKIVNQDALEWELEKVFKVKVVDKNKVWCQAYCDTSLGCAGVVRVQFCSLEGKLG